ncbi:hypothetical protein B481_3091 [Planococcus halocryophilus Or1]|uniref:hypothetical protein n=1 Tax=Planococcus halocryophilus TaxID=1215089 RepID=UPI0002B8AB09|nr:hypothetical protein [Planococcus halocryophilus]EMF45540.1 hypothetical protein B481_3091 [Planococcus halocryophilus Or1]
MNWKQAKKTVVAVPLSAVLLASAGIGTVSASTGNTQVPEMAPTVETPAAQLRSDLSNLLSTHFIYQSEVALLSYHEAKEGGPTGEGLAEAQEELEINGEQLTEAVKSVYGQEAADAFDKIFDTQYEDSAGYGAAVASGDQEKIDQVKKDLLTTFPTDLGTLLSQATGGNLPKDTAISILQEHEKDVMEFLTYSIDGNFEEAYAEFNEGYERMFTVGTALSSAIVTQMPDKFEGSKAVTPASDLRATFSQLLGAHFYYQTATSVEAYKAAAGEGGEAFEAVSEMQEANAEQMTAAVKSLYGQEAADAFNEIFSTQYEDSEALGKAVAEGNTEKVNEITDNLLNTFAVDLGTLLSGATEGKLPKETAIAVLQQHEQTTIDILNSYVEGDYQAVYETFTEGHALMFTIGQALSGAIVQQNPEKFAEAPGMPETGMGGMADSGTMNWMLVTFPLLALAGALIFTRRKSLQE